MSDIEKVKGFLEMLGIEYEVREFKERTLLVANPGQDKFITTRPGAWVEFIFKPEGGFINMGVY